MTKRKVFAYNGPDLLDCHELEPLMLGGKNRRFAPFTFQTERGTPFPLLSRAAVRILYLLLPPTEVVLGSERSIATNPKGRMVAGWKVQVHGAWIRAPWSMPRPDGRAVRLLLRRKLLREEKLAPDDFRYTLTESGTKWIETFLDNPTPPPHEGRATRTAEKVAKENELKEAGLWQRKRKAPHPNWKPR